MEIRDSSGNLINIDKIEKREQDLARKYVLEDDVVLELGARFGSVSCVANQNLNNKKNQVVVEPDERVWDALEKNKERNNCDFHIVKGFISKKKYDLTNLTNCYGYGSTAIENKNSNISSYSLEEISAKYNLNFNVLIADCEGFLEIFFDENPDLYDKLRACIFEADYVNKCNYDKIKTTLLEKGFKKILEGHQNVFIKN